MYDTQRKTWSETNYQQMLEVDADGDAYINFLDNSKPLIMSDIMDRNLRAKLQKFTFSLNPAIYDLIRRLESIREDIDIFDKRKKTTLSHPTLGVDNERPPFTYKSVREVPSPHEQSNKVPIQVPSEHEQLTEGPIQVPSEHEQLTEGPIQVPSDDIKTASRSMKDDRTGKDHIGHSDYAKVLAALLVFKGEHPFVVGILGQWGAGKVSQDASILTIQAKNVLLLLSPSKIFYSSSCHYKSFILTKLQAWIKYFVVKDVISRYTEKQKRILPEKDSNLKSAEKCMKWIEEEFKKDETFIDAVDMWIKVGFDDERFEYLIDQNQLNYDEISNVVKSRESSFAWYCELLSLALSLVTLGGLWIQQLLSSCRVENSELETLKKAWLNAVQDEKGRQEPKADIREADDSQGKSVSLGVRRLVRRLFGCLGASHRKNMINMLNWISRRFSDMLNWISRRFRCDDYTAAKDGGQETDREESRVCYEYEFVWFNAWLYCGSEHLWASLIHVLHKAVESHYGSSYTHAKIRAEFYRTVMIFASSIVIVGIGAVWAFWGDGVIVKSVGKSAEWVGGVGAIIIGGIGSVYSTYSYIISASISSKSTEISAEAVPSYKEKLGYMHGIKEDMFTLGKHLVNPDSMPTFWDYLLPRTVLEYVPRRWLCRANPHLPCRLLIVVDDLDRCPPEQCVKVLEALVLLTENTPFIIMLAVDPRVVVAAIESVNDTFYKKAGVNGYEYLEKIIQVMKLCLPIDDADHFSCVSIL